MDTDKLNNKAISLFKSFVNDIISVYPEYKTKFYEHYGSILVGETNDITTFLNNINKYEKLITNRKEELFKDDIYIFEDIPMSDIWKSDISESTKENIWKYLQTFCVIHINLKSSESLKELLSGETDSISSENKKDLKDLKKIKKMKEDMSKNKASEGLFEGLGDLNIENMLNNSTIGKIAKEISESIDMPNLESGDDISKLFDGNNIMNIFSKVNETVQQKMSSGELNDDILKSEATNMYPDMMNNNLFKSMTENMGNIVKEMEKTQETKETNPEKKSDDNSIKINNNNLV